MTTQGPPRLQARLQPMMMRTPPIFVMMRRAVATLCLPSPLLAAMPVLPETTTR